MKDTRYDVITPDHGNPSSAGQKWTKGNLAIASAVSEEDHTEAHNGSQRTGK